MKKKDGPEAGLGIKIGDSESALGEGPTRITRHQGTKSRLSQSTPETEEGESTGRPGVHRNA